MPTLRRAGFLVSCCVVLAARAGAQTAEPHAPNHDAPLHLSVVEGQVFLDREERTETAVANVPLLAGDRLRTEAGRAEVVCPDGSLLHVDRATVVDVMATDLLRLLEGRLALTVHGAGAPDEAVRYQIDAPAASVQTRGPGEFRISSMADGAVSEVELAVFRGEAVLANDAGAQAVRAGELAVARDDLAPSRPQYFNSARWDEFDAWSARRRQAARSAVSVDDLPPDLAPYAATFDRYGVWRDDPIDGRVWYPTVAADWRPYSVGYWRSYPAWDAFWVAGDPWGWPTHHYGRWGFSHTFGWYWMPARVWGPSWVYWAYAPGYVSWCALGRWNNPVFGLFGLLGSIVGNRVDPWRGWNIIERRHYGSFQSMHRVAFDGRRLGRDDYQRFAVQRRAPGWAPGERGGPVPGTPDRQRDVRGPDGRGGAQRPAWPTVPRRSFANAEPRSGAAPRTQPARPTPDVTAFSNRRTGPAERPSLGSAASSGSTRAPSSRSLGSALGSALGTAPRPAYQRTPSAAAGSSRPLPSSRSLGSALGTAPRPAYQRAPAAGAGSSRPLPSSRSLGSALGTAPRPAYQRAPAAGAGSSRPLPSSRSLGSAFGTAPRPAYQRAPAAGAGNSSPLPSSRSLGSAFGSAPRAAVPRGGSMGSGSSSSRAPASRYNPGSGGARQPGGGAASARPRGGRTPAP
ncbi:MAG TPA: FecR domain-containing protein [Vicinamibacterales bacterium]|nr:FecR domain-containing protein [Vicinamibacterales bacterium]